MLILGLFILLLVSAISAERINGIIINRAASLILLYSFILSVVTLDVSVIGCGIGVYGGLYQVTVISKIMECFIYLLGALILTNTTLILSKNNGLALWPKDKNERDSFDLNNNYLIKTEYPLIALFTVVGGVLLINSNDLISMYLSIELQSFSLYVLATIYRDSQAATSAGLKYFLLGGLSSGFILLGSSLLYSYWGVTNLEALYLLMSGPLNLSFNLTSNESLSLILDIHSQPELNSSNYLFNNGSYKFKDMGLLILVIGFLFKIAAAPLHNWSPDVYDGVPTKVTCWLAVIAKISILTFLLHLTLIGQGVSLFFNLSSISNIIKNEELYTIEISSLSNLLIISAFLSLLIGTIVGLAQTRIKRLYAYSTISHLGFLLLAIAINTTDSIESFIFYLISYSLTSANAFFVLIAFGSLSLTLTGHIKDKENDKNSLEPFLFNRDIYKKETKGKLIVNNGTNNYNNNNNNINTNTNEEEYSPVQFISQLKGQFKRDNSASILLSLSLGIILFSMAGIPPLVGFFAKQSVLLCAVKNGFIFLSLVAIIASVISAAYYLRIVKVMLFDEIYVQTSNFNNTNKVNWSHLKKPLNSSINLNTETTREDSSNKKNLFKGPVKGLVSNLEKNSNLYLIKSYKGEISNVLSFSISLLTILTIFFVFKPFLILNACHIMALSVFYI